MDFTSSVTLQFRDLFSAGFREARQNLIEFRTSLNEISSSSTAMSNITPPAFSAPAIPAPQFSGMDDLDEMLGGSTAQFGGIPITLPAPVVPAPVIPAPQLPAMDDLDEMLGGSTAHLTGMAEGLEGIGKGFEHIIPKAGMFDQGLDQIKSGLDKIGQNSSLNMVAAQLSTMAYMTQPLRNALSAMMDEPSKLAGTFESSMKNIQAITGLSAAEIANLGNELLSIGSKSAAGPQAVAGAYNDVAGGITNVTAQMPVLTNAIALAEAGQADLGTAANGLVKIMNSYNFTTGEAAEISERAAWASDVMTQAVGMGVGSMQEFISAMAPISGMAASVSVGFDEIGSTMAYMTATTDTAGTAGTKLQSFMVALQKPSDALASALAAVGITSGSAMMAQYGLAESASIVMQAFGGNQDAMTAAMGRVEAMQAVVSLTGGTYTEFAAEFGSAMDGITAKSQAIQTEAYESKMARFQAATGGLKIQVGDDINAVKGFFVDMGTGFLTHVVSPIMSSPIGGVFQGIAAGTGIALQGILSFGSGALNTAAQFSVLAANIKNAGGYVEMFKGVMSLAGAPFKAIGGLISTFVTSLFGIGASSGIAAAGTGTLGAAGAGAAGGIGAAAGATGAFAASLWAAAWPILAVVAAIALVAGGVYLLVKNWDAVSAFFVNLWQKVTGAFSAAWNWIKNLFGSMPNWVLGLVAVFFPFIGIPLLIIKNWDSIKAFFINLWGNVTNAFQVAWAWIKGFFTALWEPFKAPAAAFAEWLGGLWSGIAGGFTLAWGYVSQFFVSLWSGIVNFMSSVAAWFGGLWTAVTTGFTIAWTHVSTFFSNLWTGMVNLVMSAANWFSGVWASVTGGFAGAWSFAGNLFASVWDNIKGVVIGFAEWLSPFIDVILAPFRAIGSAIGWITGKIGDAVTAGNEAAAAKQAELALAAAPGLQAASATVTTTGGQSLATTNPPVPEVPRTTVTAPTLEPIMAQPVPAATGPVTAVPPFTGAADMRAVPAGPVAPVPSFTAAAGMGAAAALEPAAAQPVPVSPAVPAAADTLTGFAASRASAPELTHTASSAFTDALAAPAILTLTPSIDMSALERQVDLQVQSVPIPQAPALEMPWRRPAVEPSKQTGPVSITIQNQTIQAADIKEVMDFARILLSLAHQPEEAAV